ncbi:Neprilysin-2 [Chionoecetes opilio]|uniref:Neprilysin-2 n=1 Tax=Chionoecetes opilio TaxID=41210 RepID=A0A8J5D3E4_CHIOP|nr:Neprilysin-2 [Chionoecetes opilio]
MDPTDLVACPCKKSVLLFLLLTSACSCGRLLQHRLTARFFFLSFPLAHSAGVSMLPVISAEALTADHPDVCLTKGCVKAASALIESMNEDADPCEDFFDFACGGFLNKTIIPDDKTTISRFNQISDKLQLNLRGLVEAEIVATDPTFSKMVKNLYKSCMDTDNINLKGLTPLTDILDVMGGWPVLEGDTWDPSAFDWTQNVYINRQLGYSLDYIFDFSIDQPPLGMPSRKYLLKGFNDTDVQAYYNYQVSMAVLLGANRTTAEKDLKESLEFDPIAT